MCQSMVDIQPAAAEIRRGKKKDRKIDRKKLQGKNIMAPLLHRAAITKRSRVKVTAKCLKKLVYGLWIGDKPGDLE